MPCRNFSLEARKLPKYWLAWTRKLDASPPIVVSAYEDSVAPVERQCAT